MSQKNQKILSAQEKANAALEAACAIQPIEQIAQKYGVYPHQIEQWKQKLIKKSPLLFTDHVQFDCSQPPSNDWIFQSKQTQLRPQSPQSSKPEKNLARMPIKQVQKINNVLIFKNFTHTHTDHPNPKTASQFTEHQEKIKEKERKRIAREIHDDLGQNLLAMRMDILMLQRHTAHTHAHLHERVNIVLNNLDTTIQSVKSIVNNLRPLKLDFGLQAGIEWLLKTFERISGIHCLLLAHEATFVKFAHTLNNEQTLAIFRILQEALSNIIRHAFATKVEVVIDQNKYLFSMAVKDNGVGIQHLNENKNNSFGIIGIKERLLSINGECMIDSQHGTGTTLRIAIPIGQKSSETRHEMPLAKYSQTK